MGTFFDLFDVHYQFYVNFGDGKAVDNEEERAITTLGVTFAGFGALTMIGGKLQGAHSFVEGAWRVRIRCTLLLAHYSSNHSRYLRVASALLFTFNYSL